MNKFKDLLFEPASFQIILEENILPFWMEKMVDNRFGGFYGRIDGQNNLYNHADKGIILNSRILWTFSAAMEFSDHPQLKSIADRAYNYIMTHFLDKEYGGVYWMVDYTGSPVDEKKQVYALAFVTYALAEYYKINKSPDVLKLARKQYELIEKYSFDPLNNGYLEAFNREWHFSDKLTLSEKEVPAAKTMNTHLHVLEAYSNLFSIWPDQNLKERLKDLIRLFIDKFIDQNGHFHLFFSKEWESSNAHYSYGHDIEGGWLLHEAASLVEDPYLIEKVNEIAIKLTNAALEGLDADGGLMNEGGREGVTDTDKHWWPQAEAMVGLINAWQISQNETYMEKAKAIWHFVLNNLLDPEAGEWFWMTNKAGEPNLIEDKAGPWKCPYHNGRAMFELIKRLS